MSRSWGPLTSGQAGSTRPVVLVHGIFDTSKIFTPMASWLQSRGFQPMAPDLTPSDGTMGLDELAAQLGAFADQHLPGVQFDLVGFSMGGLIARYYVQRLGGMERVRRLVTISAPHHGSFAAYTLGSAGSKQMRPGSAFLKELNRDAASLQRVRFASIWTPFDLMIIPATSSRLGIGEECRIPVAIHPLMLQSRRSFELITELLEA